MTEEIARKFHIKRVARAHKLSPKDKENAERALLELCVYWGEKVLDNQ